MAFCSNCGHKLEQGVRFCSGFGSPVSGQSGDGRQRKQVFEGEIHKWPNLRV